MKDDADNRTAGEALGETVAAASNWTEGGQSSGPTNLPNGTRVGRYVVLDPIGYGGMGAVYRAYDPRLDRRVAIKLLRPDASAGATATTRLLREARALAKLAHPNIVAVYDADEHDDSVFIAMELVDGVTLRDWLRVRDRSQDEIARSFADAARALAAAHEVGVVHRDFKPANVMVGDDGRVRVLDFGLARVHGADDEDDDANTSGATAAADRDVALTRTGAILGTPAYMAPEQHTGGRVGAAADQFALCVSLYEALYGEHPFGGDTAAEMAALVTAGVVRPAPSDRSVPEWMRALLLRGLAPSPADRYPSMADLLAELTRDRNSGRRRARWAAGGTVLVGLIAIAVVWLARGTPQRAARVDPCSGVETMLDDTWNDDRRAALARASPNPATATAVQRRLDAYAAEWTDLRMQLCRKRDEAYGQRVQCLDAARVALGTVAGVLVAGKPAVFDNVEPVLGQLAPLDLCTRDAGMLAWRRPPADDEALAERRRIGARVTTGYTLRAAEDRAGARAIADELAAAIPTMRDPFARAQAARFAGMYAATADARAEMIRQGIRDSIASRDEIGVVKGYGDLVGVLVDAAQYDEAMREADMADAHVERLSLFVDTWPGMAKWSGLLGGRIANLRGIGEQRRGNHTAAVAHLRRAVALWEPTESTHPDRILMALSNLADVLRETGQLDEAIATFDRALPLAEAIASTSPGTYVTVLQNRAAALLTAGRADRAEADFLRALSFAGDRPIAGNIAYNLASLYIMREDLDKVPPLLAQSKERWIAAMGPNTPYLHLLPGLECSAARIAGQLADAEALCRRAIDGLSGTIGAGHPFVAAIHGELALVHIDAGRYRDAVASAQTALAIFGKTTGLDTAEAVVAKAAFGRALLRQGPRHYDDADAALADAVDTYGRMKLPTHPGLVAPLLDRAELSTARGDADGARALVARAAAIADASEDLVPSRERARLKSQR